MSFFNVKCKEMLVAMEEKLCINPFITHGDVPLICLCLVHAVDVLILISDSINKLYIYMEIDVDIDQFQSLFGIIDK